MSCSKVAIGSQIQLWFRIRTKWQTSYIWRKERWFCEVLTILMADVKHPNFSSMACSERHRTLAQLSYYQTSLWLFRCVIGMFACLWKMTHLPRRNIIGRGKPVLWRDSNLGYRVSNRLPTNKSNRHGSPVYAVVAHRVHIICPCRACETWCLASKPCHSSFDVDMLLNTRRLKTVGFTLLLFADVVVDLLIPCGRMNGHYQLAIVIPWTTSIRSRD